jgi:Tfp pilus assembly protein PilX
VTSESPRHRPRLSAPNRRPRRGASGRPSLALPARGGGHAQRGASLLEALIGFVIVTLGLLGTAQWQQRLRQAADLARQQAAAVRLAQDELEALRAIAARGRLPSPSGFDALGDAESTRPAQAGARTTQALSRQLAEGPAPALKQVRLQIAWEDHRGGTHSLQLGSTLAAPAPALAAALAQVPAGLGAAPRLGRHAGIPAGAADLGDGRSVFKPRDDGDEAWLFNHRSGRIVGRCTGLPGTRGSAQLTAADLSDCGPADAVLLSGRVRFALSTTPDPAAANDLPLPLAVTLQLSSSGHPAAPVCQGEAMRLLEQASLERPRTLTVPVGLDPASLALAGWRETGERWWQYHCAVPRAPASAPGRAPVWSGRLSFSAIGWTLGTVPGSQRLCRYSADTDGSGAVDRPAESPETLSDVDDALTEQNFLVVDGSLPCPTAAAASLAASPLPWSHVNAATVPHQP